MPHPAALEGGVPPHGVAFSLFMVCKLAGSLVYVLLQQRGLCSVHSLLSSILVVSTVSLAARYRTSRTRPHNTLFDPVHHSYAHCIEPRSLLL